MIIFIINLKCVPLILSDVISLFYFPNLLQQWSKNFTNYMKCYFEFQMNCDCGSSSPWLLHTSIVYLNEGKYIHLNQISSFYSQIKCLHVIEQIPYEGKNCNHLLYFIFMLREKKRTYFHERKYNNNLSLVVITCSSLLFTSAFRYLSIKH